MGAVGLGAAGAVGSFVLFFGGAIVIGARIERDIEAAAVAVLEVICNHKQRTSQKWCKHHNLRKVVCALTDKDAWVAVNLDIVAVHLFD